MNKNVILIAIGVLVLIVILAVFAFSREPVAQVSPTPIVVPILLPTQGTKLSPTPTATPPLKPIPTGATININTDGGVVPVTNFYKQPIETNAQNNAVVTSEADFQIIYLNEYESFIISLLSQPLASARTKAEAAFLKSLNITKAQACKLSVSVSVPYGVDQNRSGQELGLSFCPGAIVL